jgi:hypothetical protein
MSDDPTGRRLRVRLERVFQYGTARFSEVQQMDPGRARLDG